MVKKEISVVYWLIRNYEHVEGHSTAIYINLNDERKTQKANIKSSGKRSTFLSDSLECTLYKLYFV